MRLDGLGMNITPPSSADGVMTPYEPVVQPIGGMLPPIQITPDPHDPYTLNPNPPIYTVDVPAGHVSVTVAPASSGLSTTTLLLIVAAGIGLAMVSR